MHIAPAEDFITRQLIRLCDSALGSEWERVAQDVIDFAFDDEYRPLEFGRFALMHYKNTGIVGVFDTKNKSCFVISYAEDHQPHLVVRFVGDLDEFLEDLKAPHHWLIEYSADRYRLPGASLRQH